jgi:hypothetical protein
MCLGEKRIVDESDVAAGAGEGIYWKYESALKKWDAIRCWGSRRVIRYRTNLYPCRKTLS